MKMLGHQESFMFRILSNILGLKLAGWIKRKMGKENEKGKV